MQILLCSFSTSNDTIRYDTLFNVDITLSYQLVYRKSTVK